MDFMDFSIQLEQFNLYIIIHLERLNLPLQNES